MTSFEQLLQIVKTLRGPNGCPWDKEQTHKSLTSFAIEEAYELEAAILNQDETNLKEELGDLLFQTVLHSEIARSEGRFDIEEVLQILNEKMIRRHPHVFADAKAGDSTEVLKNWEAIKAEEKKAQGQAPALLQNPDIPQNLPALTRAHKIGKFTAKVGFDWENPQQVLTKVEEELQELKEAMNQNSLEHCQEELGDLLFSCAQLGRHLKIDSDKALREANHKFLDRWQRMFQLDPNFEKLSPEAKEALWQQVKVQTSTSSN